MARWRVTRTYTRIESYEVNADSATDALMVDEDSQVVTNESQPEQVTNIDVQRIRS